MARLARLGAAGQLVQVYNCSTAVEAGEAGYCSWCAAAAAPCAGGWYITAVLQWRLVTRLGTAVGVLLQLRRVQAAGI